MVVAVIVVMVGVASKVQTSTLYDDASSDSKCVCIKEYDEIVPLPRKSVNLACD